MSIENITEILSEKYSENYGMVFDFALSTRLKLSMRNPVKYIFKDFQLLKDTENLLDRYYRMKLYKSTYRLKK